MPPGEEGGLRLGERSRGRTSGPAADTRRHTTRHTPSPRRRAAGSKSFSTLQPRSYTARGSRARDRGAAGPRGRASRRRRRPRARRSARSVEPADRQQVLVYVPSLSLSLSRALSLSLSRQLSLSLSLSLSLRARQLSRPRAACRARQTGSGEHVARGRPPAAALERRRPSRALDGGGLLQLVELSDRSASRTRPPPRTLPTENWLAVRTRRSPRSAATPPAATKGRALAARPRDGGARRCCGGRETLATRAAGSRAAPSRRWPA